MDYLLVNEEVTKKDNDAYVSLSNLTNPPERRMALPLHG
ncbi:hypothetical protein CCP3SC5AM1_1600002 [Gammaproteobacteria bacterium]